MSDYREWSERQAELCDRDHYDFYVVPQLSPDLRPMETVYLVWRRSGGNIIDRVRLMSTGEWMDVYEADVILGEIVADSPEDALARFEPDLPQPAGATFRAAKCRTRLVGSEV